MNDVGTEVSESFPERPRFRNATCTILPLISARDSHRLSLARLRDLMEEERLAEHGHRLFRTHHRDGGAHPDLQATRHVGRVRLALVDLLNDGKKKLSNHIQKGATG